MGRAHFVIFVTLPEGAGPGTAFTHEQIDAVERDVAEDGRSGFLKYRASQIQHTTFTFTMVQAKSICLAVDIQGACFAEGRIKDG